MATLIGTNNADWLIGGSGADALKGFGGNDVLKGGGGADYLDGSNGIDTAVYADSHEGVYVDLTLGTGKHGTAQGDTLYSVENLQGSSYDDGLIGDSAANVLSGLSGDDFLRGMDGADVLDGGYESDYLVGGGGGDVLTGGEGFDTVDYTDSPAGILVSLIDDVAAGGEAQGDDLNGIEHLVGSYFYGDTLIGDDGTNWIHGGGGNDSLKGLGGNDMLHGNSGSDVIVGGLGMDLLYGGGGGIDTFVWTSTDETGVTQETSDSVRDFNLAFASRLDLTGIDANVYAADNQAFTFIGTAPFSGTPGEINYYHADGNTYIQLQTGMSADVEGMIRLDGIVAPQASWFVL